MEPERPQGLDLIYSGGMPLSYPNDDAWDMDDESGNPHYHRKYNLTPSPALP
jgi:hypothetical protein